MSVCLNRSCGGSCKCICLTFCHSLLFPFNFVPLLLYPQPPPTPIRRPKLEISRVSKSSLFRIFQELCHRAGRTDLMAMPSYAQAKMAAGPFQQAKGLFFQALGQQGYGAWIGKPLEEKSFEGHESNGAPDGANSAFANANTHTHPYSTAYQSQ